MEMFSGLYGRLFRALFAALISWISVDLLEFGDLLPAHINPFKLRLLIILVGIGFVQALNEIEFLQFISYPFVFLVVVGLIGTVFQFCIPLFNNWLFDEIWSFDVVQAFERWVSVGFFIGFIVFIFNAFRFRRELHEMERLRNIAEAKKKYGEGSYAHALQLEKQRQGGFWRKLSLNPALVLMATLCTIVGFFFGSSGEFLQYMKTVLAIFE
ncbi:MAG: hypothetical protein AXW12_14845 [Thalassospira sp. Nap_22]|nr:MAG: hypothetical protein AXW12_14845 [Thalassospira sp. Nap_22]